jgi:hypothetical protein
MTKMKTKHRTMHILITGFILALGVANLLAAPATVLQVGDKTVRLQSAVHELLVSLQCPTFVFDAGVAGGALPARVKGSLAHGELLEVSYPAQAIGTNGQLEARLWLQWSAKEGVLRKWAEFQVTGAPTPLLLKEVILERVELPGEKPQLEGGGGPTGPSYPAFWPGFFAGVEFPIAATRVEGERLIVAHRTGWTLRNGEWRQSRKAVFGVASEGDERREFARYITAHRPKSSGRHVNYNSWWTLPVPFNETNVLALMQEFEQKLYKPYGVSFDSFCLDMGWSEPRSVWQISKDLFPEGFTRLQSAAAKMGSSLGLWISPSAAYPSALNQDWARTNNLETLQRGGLLPEQRWCCLGGERYATAFRTNLVAMVQRYNIRQLKLDGYVLECMETGHGHAPGDLSAEAIAEGAIAAFTAVRQVQPEIWMESTCFGYNPSPWWLFYMNSVIGFYGDDAPLGCVPSPIYRESYTTSRDYFNLQGAARLAVPIVAQEVLGVIHQSPEPFMNDAVITVLRGHAFLPLYLNPAYLDENRWKALAQFLQWSRRNAPLLEETTPILPAAWQTGKVPEFSFDEVMPREPYGYAHWKKGQGLAALRNPWIVLQVMPLRLDESLGVERGAKNLQVVSLYPEPRLYGSGARFGDTLKIPLAPYETVVLSLAEKLETRGLPKASDVVGRSVVVEKVSRELNHVEFEGPAQALGPDWTTPMANGSRALQLQLDAELSITAPTAELLILAEADKALPEPVEQSLLVDGKVVPLTSSSSATGWASTGWPVKVHWLFLKAALPGGKHQVSLKLLCKDNTPVRLSAWAWATKPGAGMPSYPNALPSPETISLDAQPLLGPVDATSVTGLVRRQLAVDKIDGTFLDALEPVSCVQGWGKLQKNQSVWEKPMTIGSRHFRRGLGTHADSRIVYDIGRHYRRFQSWVGPDGACATPTITFEVWADGTKRWESGLMNKQSPAKLADVDVAGVKTLELVVGHGGDGVNQDHANWADAKLLR